MQAVTDRPRLHAHGRRAGGRRRRRRPPRGFRLAAELDRELAREARRSAPRGRDSPAASGRRCARGRTPARTVSPLSRARPRRRPRAALLDQRLDVVQAPVGRAGEQDPVPPAPSVRARRRPPPLLTRCARARLGHLRPSRSAGMSVAAASTGMPSVSSSSIVASTSSSDFAPAETTIACVRATRRGRPRRRAAPARHGGRRRCHRSP